jgi:hypothetical protein
MSLLLELCGCIVLAAIAVYSLLAGRVISMFILSAYAFHFLYYFIVNIQRIQSTESSSRSK